MTSPHDLKTAGLKATAPRLKIINLFEASKVRHLTAEDVYRQLLSEGLDIGLATVYRVLTQFEQAGLLDAPPLRVRQGRLRAERGPASRPPRVPAVRPRRGVLRSRRSRSGRAKVAHERGFEIAEHALYLYAECVKPRCPYRKTPEDS